MERGEDREIEVNCPPSIVEHEDRPFFGHVGVAVVWGESLSTTCAEN